MKAAMKAEYRPRVPMLVQSKALTSVPSKVAVNWVTARSSIEHCAAIMVEPSFSTLPSGILRFIEAVKFLAVVPAHIMPMTPMVKL